MTFLRRIYIGMFNVEKFSCYMLHIYFLPGFYFFGHRLLCHSLVLSER